MRLHPALALALLPLHACDPSSDTKNDGRETGIAEEPSPLDEDGDGFSAAEGDCDEGNSDVNPGAVELCNGVDDNCDGYADEGVTGVFYADVDGDGFGDPDAASTSCEQAPGFVGQGTDCDDADATRYPGAPETCDDSDDDCDGEVDEGLTTVYYADADGDGHGDPATGAPACAAPEGAVAAGDDCDDTEPDAAPGLEERCDEVDNDCDGATDEGVTSVFYADLDGDGHGDPELALDACAVPTGYATTDADCDDADAAVNPDAVELCNGLDDDCDGDLDDPSAADARSWYADADADAYGDASVATTACDAPAGTVADATDCDDALAAVNPGAVEVCNGIDDDCDGAVDGTSATDPGTWYLDYDGDGRGGARFSVAACTAPAGYVASSDDCDDAAVLVYPGASEICDGADNDCDTEVDESLATSDWYADADGDGYGDPAAVRAECAAPSGFVADATDCDDAAFGVNPGAAETCDGEDEDCDGRVDEGLLGRSASCPAADCAEILALDPTAADGVYSLDPGAYYCDMTTDGGGWTRVKDDLAVWGTGYDGTAHNSEGFAWNEALFAYAGGSVTAHCNYPSSLTGCNNLGFQFGAEAWGVPLNWGSSICGMATTSYTGSTTYIGGYDFVVARADSADTIRVGTLEGISACTTGDNPGTAYLDLYVRR